MAGRQKSFRGEHASDEVFDFECGPCKFDGKNLEANGFCSDCSEYLCELCFRTHLKPMPCRHHILLDASKMPRDKSAVKTVDVSTVRCEKHAANVIEYYCSIHEYIGCSTCMTLEHRACEGVNHIPSITKELYETREYVEFKQSVNAVVKSTARNGLEIKRNTTETERIYKKTKEAIKQYRKEINSFIDNLENKIDTELSKLNDNYISLLQEATDYNKSLENEITTVAEEVTNREKQVKRIDSFVFMKRTKGSIQQCTKKAGEILDKSKVRKYSFRNEFDKYKPSLIGLFGSIVEEATTKQKHYELPTYGPELEREMYLGARVQRGKNWKYTNQDGHGPDTVTKRNTSKKYEEPTYGPELKRAMYVGARVQRGHDWKWNDQDGNGPGTVTKWDRYEYKSDWVSVIWDNENTTIKYRLGHQNAYDIMFVPGTYDASKSLNK